MSYKTQQKLEALTLWEKHGIKASMDAYHISPSSTLCVAEKISGLWH